MKLVIVTLVAGNGGPLRAAADPEYEAWIGLAVKYLSNGTTIGAVANIIPIHTPIIA